MASVAHRHFVGVDLHRTVAQVCVVDRDGERVWERRIRIDSSAGQRELVDRILGLARPRVAVEALGVNRWFVNALLASGLELGRDVRVAHPAALELKKSGRKTDRRDARELARRLRMGDLEKRARSYYPSDAEYDTRRVTRTRHRLVQLRQKLGSQLNALFAAYGQQRPARIVGEASRQRVAAALAHLPAGELAGRALLEVLASVESALRGLNREIRERAARHAGAQRLDREVPQIAALTALTIHSELGDLSRFTSTRQVASFPGLVPKVEGSGERIRHGGLCQHGNRELRWILVQVAVRLMARHPLARAWAAKRLHRTSKKRLRVALARRLLIGIYCSERDGTAFSLARALGHPPSAT